jgi:hypothetical protein
MLDVLVKFKKYHIESTILMYTLETWFRVALQSHLSIYLSVALEFFVGNLVALQFLNLIHSLLQISLDGGSTRRKAVAYTRNNSNTEQTHTDIHALSWIRTHDPKFRANEGNSCLRPRAHCDRPLQPYPK